MVTIDLSSHAAGVVGPTNAPFSFALAFDPAGKAYTISNLFSATLAQLACLDAATGNATLLGSPLGENLQIMGLIASPEGTLYGAAVPATAIYQISSTTGAPNPVGASATNGEIMSFAYAPDGTLYAASCCTSPTLYTVDLATGNTTPVTALSLSSVMGIAIDAEGSMYATRFVPCPPCSSVYRIDPGTGAATELFNTGIPFIHNIAFSPGTPAQQIAALNARVDSLGLLGGIATSLDVKLAAALQALNAGNTIAACNVLGAFQNQVNALPPGMLSDTATRQLTFANTRLRTALGCQ